ncbi:MAG: M28 family peptidase [Acidobacteria bacterium]|nr:M28 family peptidase [Acidobacteriota bacterium]
MNARLIMVYLTALVVYLCVAAADTIRYKPVSRETVEARLGRYTGNDQRREQTLKQMFAEAGCDGQQVSEQTVKGSKLPNVICVLRGSSDKIIIVGAHFDHVPEGDGVVDNWSGASLLPSLYEALKSERRSHSYVFVGFTDEEKGEVGSRFYAHAMTREQVQATDAMVNLDTLGLAPSAIWESHSDKRLTTMFFYLASQLGFKAQAINVERVGSTDSEQFAARKIASITVHSLTQQAFDRRAIHSYNDKLSSIQRGDYYNTFRLLSVYLAYLDGLSPAHSPTH